MSAVWEEDETDELQLQHSNSNISNSSAYPSSLTAHSLRRSRTVPSARSSIITPSNASLKSKSNRTVSLPTPLQVSSGTTESTTGYSSLTLPRAAYTPSKHPERVSSSIDLTRSGLAQTTMSTIAITRKSHQGGSAAARLVRLHSNQVLVKVWAVGLDGLDAVLVKEKMSKSEGFGYVPGRSFVGRVMECGWDVDTVVKGDWVIGLTEVKKGGALAEFIIISHRRVHRCCNPIATTSLSVPQLALLPLSAVPAHRAVRTLSHLSRGSKVLVLRADVGIGLLASQELVHLGFSVTAQVPGGIRGWGSEGERRARMVVEGLAVGSRGSTLERKEISKVKGDVRCGDVFDVIHALETAKEEFEAIIDTVGGKDIWDACRAILKSNGQFTTLVGDMLYFNACSNPSSPSSLTAPSTPNFKPPCSLPTAQTHFMSNLRSLRFSLLKKNKKNIGYVWISPCADVDPSGEDIRDSLASVIILANNGVFKPCVNPRTFQNHKGGSVGTGTDNGRPRSPSSSLSSTSNSNRLSLTLSLGPGIQEEYAHLEGLIFPFERTPEAFKGDMITGTGTVGALMQGGSVVIQITE
ncbi:hypothetical protein Clacol_001439 [Clathrus columnatus]|uniref:Rhodanese domain-containing protein n=1 Tax=Clathrus columnatus TaxID=1419009 RepID=A0AAV5A3A8_9AGAM|nr:hypothetical protein Clacol_001439 [Clathrus columnatus]